MACQSNGSYGPISFELITGSRIPSVGLGTWKAPSGVVGDAVIAAVKAGYRHIDCARVYDNEKEIGLALKKLFSDGIVHRGELWITSKLWCSDHAPEDVTKALSKTLDCTSILENKHPCLLGGESFGSLSLEATMHWPFRMKPATRGWDPEVIAPLNLPETWKAMEDLVMHGKVRAIGVSKFSTKKLQDLMSYATIKPAVNQVECHPVWQQPNLHDFCQSTSAHLSAYSPLGSPGSWVKGEILKEQALLLIAEKLKKTPAQVALRWGIQSGHSVLPKSINPSRIKENFDIFDWSIPDDLFSKFSEIQQKRLLRG